MESIRILVADDNATFRKGLLTLLKSIPVTEVIGEAISGEEAILLAGLHQPDIILMDLKMPDLNGIEATRRIVQTSPHIGVLILTMFQDDDSVFAAMRAGARGYILKGANQDEILRAICAVESGEAIFSRVIAQRLMHFFSVARPAQVFPELTEREREILTLIAQGYKNPEIAERFTLSPKTVRNHVSNIISKLQVTDRAQAVLRAREAGITNTGLYE